MDQVEIQAVPRRHRGAAISFLVGQTDSDRRTRARTQAMQQMVARAGTAASRLWWARSGRKTLASALVVEAVGRTATLFFSPPDTPGVDRKQLSNLIVQISADAVEGGMSLVQSLIEPEETARIEVLAESGMILLADLLYMGRDLLSCPPGRQIDGDELVWRNFQQFTEAELADIISRSYADSLDCPALRGVRDMPDVIAGHKSSGSFCPEAWWIVSCPGESTPTGCIIVNDSVSGPSSDIIYMGVAPEFRRRGLARAMLHRVIAQAGVRDRQGVSVAVDRQNDRAMGVYRECGFVEIRRRLAYAKLKTRS